MLFGRKPFAWYCHSPCVTIGSSISWMFPMLFFMACLMKLSRTTELCWSPLPSTCLQTPEVSVWSQASPPCLVHTSENVPPGTWLHVLRTRHESVYSTFSTWYSHSSCLCRWYHYYRLYCSCHSGSYSSYAYYLQNEGPWPVTLFSGNGGFSDRKRLVSSSVKICSRSVTESWTGKMH